MTHIMESFSRRRIYDYCFTRKALSTALLIFENASSHCGVLSIQAEEPLKGIIVQRRKSQALTHLQWLKRLQKHCYT